jgi:sulfate transport system substrate-binding protein
MVALLAVAACSSAGTSDSRQSLVAYSTPKPVYDQLTKDFAKTSKGKGVTWRTSYGASGDQSRAVESNLSADYVAFSLQTDMDRLVKDGKVATSWNQGPTKGMISDSVVVIVVRKGNPKHIEGWSDLVKPGIKIVTPDPGSSGSARWNTMAAYGQVVEGGGSPQEGEAYLRAFFKNVVASPSSGREATSTFTSGTGDVLISYENEAIFARQHDQAVDYIVPSSTLLIENPAAVTVHAAPAAKAFLAFAQSAAGQRVFAANGYRPVIDGIHVRVDGANNPTDPFPQPAKLFTIADLGGWTQVATKFFDEHDGIVTKIQQAG